MSALTSPNEEAIRAWDGPLFDIFQTFRPELVNTLALHGDRAFALFPPAPGARVLDIGCGFGETTQRLGELVGPDGEAVGIDAAPRFIEAAASESKAANVRFVVADPQTQADFGGTYDAAYARFGTMFFANPVVALRNVASALVPGGRLTMVVWRRKLDNEWTLRAERIVKSHVDRPDESDEPTCGPGPFSMADADTVCDVLVHAGYEDIALHRSDPKMVFSNLDRVVEMTMAIGPGGEVLRLLGDRADHARPIIERELREGMSEFVGEDGRVYAPSSSWVVSAVRGR